jgi:AbrB family looped-hinge helix DNA binding protein
MHDNTSTITKRGQVSVPAPIRKALNLKAGQKLRWEQVSDSECRVYPEVNANARGPMAMLGYALKYNHGLSTDEWMQILREGDQP